MQFKINTMLPVWLVILLIACQEKVILQVCPNQDLLYTQAADSLPVFDVGEDKALYPFLDSLVEIYKQNEDNPSNGYFVWRDSVDYLISLDPIEWAIPPIACYLSGNRLKILLNNQGQLLVNGRLYTIPDLDSIWQMHQSNNGKDPELADAPEKASAEICIDTLSSVNKLGELLHFINTGRNRLLLNAAKHRFDTAFCALPIDSVQDLTWKYPLNLTLIRNGYAWYEVPEPPPTVDEIEF